MVAMGACRLTTEPLHGLGERQGVRARLDCLKVRPWFERAAECLPDGQEKPNAPQLLASGCAET